MLLSDHLHGEKRILTERKHVPATFFLLGEGLGKGKFCGMAEDFARRALDLQTGIGRVST